MQIEEVIKELKSDCDCIYWENGKCQYDNGQNKCSKGIAIDTVLNYIETMHKEFDRLEGIEDNTAMLKQELKEQTEANKELNKVLIHFKAVINEMAKMINNHDIDEDICKQMGKKKDCNDYADEENCIDCIKEYFSEKVQK